MGYQVGWFAVRGATVDQVCEELDVKVGAPCGLPDDRSIAQIDDWVLVYADGEPLMDDVQLCTLSSGTSVVVHESVDSVMQARTALWKDGALAWSATVALGGTEESAVSTVGLDPNVEQSLHDAFAQSGAGTYDEVAELARRLVGFRHDQVSTSGISFNSLVHDRPIQWEHNQAKQCVERLERVHGYQHVIDDLFVRQVDDQHALLVWIDSKGWKSARDEPVRVGLGLKFSVARRDINEFLLEHDPGRDRREPRWMMRATLGSYPFVDRSYWYSHVPFSEYVDKVDEIANQVASFADLTQIEAEFFKEPPPRLIYAWAAVANSALNGDDRANDLWQRFMEVQVGDRQPLRERAQAFYDNAAEFRRAHPDGIERS